jgi:hypothetical protein
MQKGELKKERKENGVFKEFYDDEQLKSEETYKKGKREGNNEQARTDIGGHERRGGQLRYRPDAA